MSWHPGSVTEAMLAGARGHCPQCRNGRLFGRFLKVRPTCNVCGEAYHHHRADDFPAYLVILIVGHVVVPMVLAVEVAFMPPYWVHAALWVPLIVGMGLGLLQPIKGAIVALQWKMGMHGFGEAARGCDAAA